MNNIIELREPDGTITAVEAAPFRDRITRTTGLMRIKHEGPGAAGTAQNEMMIVWAENRSPALLETFVHAVARQAALDMAHTAPAGIVPIIADNLIGFAMTYRRIRPDGLQTVTTLPDASEDLQLTGGHGEPLQAQTDVFVAGIASTVDLMGTSLSASGKKLGLTASMLSAINGKFPTNVTREFVDEVLTRTADRMLRETTPPIFPFTTGNMTAFARAWRTMRPVTDDNEGENK